MSGERLASLNIASCVNRRVSITGIVKDIVTKSMKNGAAMMTFNLVDNSVQRGVVIFDVTTYLADKVNSVLGKPVCVTVDVKPYDKGEDGVSCVMYDIEIDETANIDDFIPSVSNLDWYVSTMNQYLGYINGTVYGKIACHLLTKNWSLFSVMPGGHSQHHDLKGGLLMHTVCVAINCLSDYQNYSNIYGADFINLSLLLSGALIHDIGKCYELEYDGMGGCKYSDQAALENHTLIGMSLVDRAAVELGYGECEEVKELRHLIASHHDKLEWGAAIRPATIEAIILARADEKDALVNKFFKKTSDIETGQLNNEWVGGGSLNCYYKGMTDSEAKENLKLLEYEKGNDTE